MNKLTKAEVREIRRHELASEDSIFFVVKTVRELIYCKEIDNAVLKQLHSIEMLSQEDILADSPSEKLMNLLAMINSEAGLKWQSVS